MLLSGTLDRRIIEGDSQNPGFDLGYGEEGNSLFHGRMKDSQRVECVEEGLVKWLEPGIAPHSRWYCHGFEGFLPRILPISSYGAGVGALHYEL